MNTTIKRLTLRVLLCSTWAAATLLIADADHLNTAITHRLGRESAR